MAVAVTTISLLAEAVAVAEAEAVPKLMQSNVLDCLGMHIVFKRGSTCYLEIQGSKSQAKKPWEGSEGNPAAGIAAWIPSF